MDLVFQRYIPADIRAKAIDKVVKIAKRFGFDPNFLMIVIYKESRWNPKAQNPNGATGLIQWLPSTAKNVHGLTTNDIKSKNILQQLDLVEAYYGQSFLKNVKYSSMYDVYFTVFMPSLIGKENGYIVANQGTKTYSQNIGLDVDNDGKITVGNIKTWFSRDVPDYSIFVEELISTKTVYLWWITGIVVIIGVAYYTRIYRKIFNWLKF